MHLGRSRNDIDSALCRMEVRKSLWIIIEGLISLQKEVLTIAEKNLDTILPYYTYGQPAQPGTLAHYMVTVANIDEWYQKVREQVEKAYAQIENAV